MEMFSFEGLKVYSMARSLVKEVYIIVRSFPKEEQFALGSQLRRASSSITANLAEGSGRISLKEKVHYVEIAYGSLAETFSELLTAQDLNYVEVEQINKLRPQFMEVSKMLSGLRQSLYKRIEDNTLTSNL